MNTQGTPISFPLRAWLAVEVLFGVGAVLAIGIAPAESATNFAWPIQPVVMAAVLGAFYITSAPLFLLPLFAKRWEMIRIMILPTALFSLVQLAATFIHWDKFTLGITPFYIWFASYLLPPPIFITAYLWHQRRLAPTTSDDPMPNWMPITLTICSTILFILAFVLFFFPNTVIPVFPWKLTPLTARSFSGWLVVIGGIIFNMSRENDRTRSRLATPMLILVLPALLLQMSRYSSEVNWSNPLLLFLMTVFAVIGFCGLYLANGNWRNALN